MLISIFLMIIISTSLTVPTQPSPRFHTEAWLPFRNREMDYSSFVVVTEEEILRMLSFLECVVLLSL